MLFDDSIVRFRWHGNESALPMPAGSDLPEDRDAKLRRLCEMISDEWKRRGRDHKPDLKRAIYQLITHCLAQAGLIAALEQRARMNKHPAFKRNHPSYRFDIGLGAIFKKGFFLPNERPRLRADLWAAFRHYIPHVLFNGFIHDQGGSEVIKGLGPDYINPSFRKWIVERRMEDGLLSRMRGTYDAEIRSVVRQKRRDLLDSGRPGDIMRMITLFAQVSERRRRL